MSSVYTLGIDVGGTKTACVLLDSHQQLIEHTTFPTEKNSELFFQNLSKQIAYLTKGRGEIASIGFAVAGQVDPLLQVVRFAPNLGWKELALNPYLSQITSGALHLVNDVQAATFAEWQLGAGVGCQDLVCIFVGTGVGGGLVVQGNLIQGSSFVAGELGHLRIFREGPLCTCGNRGCLEAFCGGWAIAKEGGRKTAKDVIAAAKNLDEKAICVLKEAKEALVLGVISLVHVLNPQKILLGGGVIEACPDWIDEIREKVIRGSLKASCQSLEILPAKLKQFSSAIGAALLAKSK